jgi:hypothetical protein
MDLSMLENLAQELGGALQTPNGRAGALVAAVVASKYALDLYQLPAVQGILPKSWRWDALGTAQKTKVALAQAWLVNGLTLWLSGTPPLQAALMAITAAAATKGVHDWRALPRIPAPSIHTPVPGLRGPDSGNPGHLG